ncbi:MAG: HEAT repeat domain-containing protein [Pirellulaceae bacterium]|nr:HEAT repeat domain-containing protein [Pirellulaceae bacterium]
MRTWFLATAALWLSCASPAGAETFLLTGGGRLEGTLQNPDQQPRTSYVVRTDQGTTITLAAEHVRQVEKSSEIRQKYEEFLAAMSDTAEAHWDMAARCEQAGLKEEREFHLQRVLTFDPNHKAARYALGYSQVDGRWVTTEQFRGNQGYTRFRGDWRLQQEAQMMLSDEERDNEVNDWKRKLKIWRSWIVKARGKEGEAVAEIRAIDRRRAAPGLVELLQEEGEPPALKLLYIEVLGKLQSQVAVTAFIDRALNDPDAQVRDRCLDELLKFGGEAAAQAFTKALKDDNNAVVNRAAAGLGRLRDEDATLPLIEALTTKHKQVLSAGGGNLGVGFSNGGLNGLSAGNRGPKVVEHEVSNQAALSALTAIHEGVNFVYDKARWRNWYAEQNTPNGINLHRLK